MNMQNVIQHFGGQQELADIVGVSQQRVSAVVKTGVCPADWVITICEASKGLIKPHDLRPRLYPEHLFTYRGTSPHQPE